MTSRRAYPHLAPADLILCALVATLLLGHAWGCSKSLPSSRSGKDASQTPDSEVGWLGSGGAPDSGGASEAGGWAGAGGASGAGGVAFSGCSIADSQFEAGAVNPTNPCQSCDPQLTATAWSNRDGVPCDDGSFCNGTDTCNAGTCSRHTGAPCLDDGLFCNGVETCDEANRRCVSSGNPCPDDGNLCNGAEACDEATKQCRRDSVPNDCGALTCGASPSGCFTCGTCSAGLACLKGKCGCTPHVGSASAASPPPVPAGLKVICLADPNQNTFAADCPIIQCGARTYWAFSPSDNSVAIGLVGYDETNTVVYQRSLIGARYIYQINLDSAAQTITFVGQSSQSVVLPWVDLYQ
jgi:hypothetical protein